MKTEKKFGVSLIIVNLTGLLVGVSFLLIDDILTGLIGFLIGLIGSSALIFEKQKD